MAIDGKPMKKPKLTAKQAKFVQGIAEGKPAYKAALAAYDTNDPNTANVIAVENLQKPTVKEALAPILDKHNINLDTAIAPIGKGLVAMKQNEYTGEITEDIKTQMAASDRALKLLGVNQENTGNTYNFVQVVNKDKEEFGL